MLDDVSTTTTYEYDELERHHQPTSTQFTNSDGKVYRTEMDYPFDFNGAAYDSMVSRNQIIQPLRTKQFVINGGVSTQTDGQETLCAFYNASGLPTGSATDPVYPHQIRRYEMTWDANDQPLVIGNGWEVQGAFHEYDLSVGKPSRYQTLHWEEDTVQ